MSSQNPAQSRDKHECGKHPDPEETECTCPEDPEEECDPHLIDCLKCQAKGVAAQAAYNADTQQAVEDARTKYDQAREEYRTKRGELALPVQDLRHQIKHLVERIKCLIKQQRVVTCLDEAYLKVVAQLEDCGVGTGCCADTECEFDTECLSLADATPAERIDAYQGLIDEYQAHIDRAKACFTTLAGEPAALAARVAAAKALIDEVNKQITADAAATDLKKVYATALVAKRNLTLELIWNGFDGTNDYVDCLCRALTCWTKGWAAVSVLTGLKAVAECERDADAKRCSDLATNTVGAILTVYDKICVRPCPPPPEPDCPDDERGSSAG